MVNTVTATLPLESRASTSMVMVLDPGELLSRAERGLLDAFAPELPPDHRPDDLGDPAARADDFEPPLGDVLAPWNVRPTLLAGLAFSALGAPAFEMPSKGR